MLISITAISTAGGVTWSSLDERLMLRATAIVLGIAESGTWFPKTVVTLATAIIFILIASALAKTLLSLIDIAVGALGGGIKPIALPSLIQSLGATVEEVLWVINAYVLVYAVLLITAGRLGDMLGQRHPQSRIAVGREGHGVMNHYVGPHGLWLRFLVGRAFGGGRW